MRLALDLRARFGDFHLDARGDYALDAVTALFGPSGSGKTTILQAIAGFRPGIGRIAVDGVTWQDARSSLPAHRRPVGYVFQDGRLFQHLDVAGNLAFADRRAAADGPPVCRDDVLDALELRPLLGRRPATLSGGETQRVAIGRAMLTRPRLLLMDEPLAALDRERKAHILAMISELPARFGLPVIFVSHLVEEIAKIAERLIGIKDGALLGEGPTPAMLENLGAEVTGHFEAGSILEGAVVDHDTDYALTAVDVGAGLLWTPGAMHADIGERVRVRLRSRDVSVSLQPLEGVSIRNQLPARLLDIREESGAHAELRLDCAGQVLRARLTRLSVNELGLQPGSRVFALVKTVALDRRLDA